MNKSQQSFHSSHDTTPSVSSRPPKIWRAGNAATSLISRHPGFSSGDPYNCTDLARKAAKDHHQSKALAGQFRHHQSNHSTDTVELSHRKATTDGGTMQKTAVQPPKIALHQWALPIPMEDKPAGAFDELLPLNRWALKCQESAEIRPVSQRRTADCSQEPRGSFLEPSWGDYPSERTSFQLNSKDNRRGSLEEPKWSDYQSERRSLQLNSKDSASTHRTGSKVKAGSRADSKHLSDFVLPVLATSAARPSLVEALAESNNQKKPTPGVDFVVEDQTPDDLEEIFAPLDKEKLPNLTQDRLTNVYLQDLRGARVAANDAFLKRSTRKTTSSSGPPQLIPGLLSNLKSGPRNLARPSLQNHRQQAHLKSSMNHLKRTLTLSATRAFSSEAWQVATRATGEEIPKEVLDDERKREVKFFVANLFGGRQSLLGRKIPGDIPEEEEDYEDALNVEDEDGLNDVKEE